MLTDDVMHLWQSEAAHLAFVGPLYSGGMSLSRSPHQSSNPAPSSASLHVMISDCDRIARDNGIPPLEKQVNRTQGALETPVATLHFVDSKDDRPTSLC